MKSGGRLKKRLIVLTQNWQEISGNPRSRADSRARHQGSGMEFKLRALLSLLALLSFGCDKPQSEVSAHQAAALSELKLGYFANATHAQAVLGVDSGEFSQAISP